jgi:hypothetical protein
MSTSVRQRLMERDLRRARMFADWLAFQDLMDLHDLARLEGEDPLRRFAAHEAHAISRRHRK